MICGESDAHAEVSQPMDGPAQNSLFSNFSRWLEGAAHATAALGCGLVLVAVGQPIFTDDLWWHLGLGQAYLDHGPYLSQDPLLFTALGPPPPTSWLMDSGLRAAWNVFGFTGIRLLHVGIATAILALVWASVRRASRNPAMASVCTALVAMLSAYRLVQLRPHLGTIAAALLLHWILFAKPEVPSWRRSFAAAALMAIWANLHPAYPIGPALVAVASGGLFLWSFLAGPADDVASRARAIRLAWVVVIGVTATLFNPLGVDGYVRAFWTGAGSENVAIVIDEWSRLQPLTWPTASLPPSRFNWVCAWLLLIIVPVTAARWLWLRVRRAGVSHASLDPAIIALAVVGLVAMMLATRFAWMAFWPVVLLASAMRGKNRARGVSLGLALIAIVLVPGFYLWGDWPMVTRGLPTSLAGFRTPYAAGKYHAHAIKFMQATQFEGNLFGRYAEGGFQSFWLGPAVRTAMNGSLNMSDEALASSFAIRERVGTTAHPRFEDVLDELGVDFFLGTGLPMEQRPGRPPNYSTIHLEGVPGWILVFRNLDSALYVRDDERNSRVLERVADYYLDAGVPYDRTLGFRPREALRTAPEWSRKYGIWTPFLGARTDSRQATRRLGPIAMVYLALGMYDEAGVANEALLRIDPSNISALRRRAWLLLRPGRVKAREELVAVFRALSRHASPSDSTKESLTMLKSVIDGQSMPAYRTQILPVFSRREAHRLLRSMNAPEPLRG
jgi:hypothetical protein